MNARLSSKSKRSVSATGGRRVIANPARLSLAPSGLTVSNIGKPSVQAKLEVGASNDEYEQEADRVADQVIRMAEPGLSPSPGFPTGMSRSGSRSGTIQRACAACASEYGEAELQARPVRPGNLCPKCRVQAKSFADTGHPRIPGHGIAPRTASATQSLEGKGQPLSTPERGYFEPRFGTDFSAVRVHHDSQANQLAAALNARAFTIGRNVVFGAGEYSPAGHEGRKLLAHELTHVIQQRPRHVERPREAHTSETDNGKPHTREAENRVATQGPLPKVNANADTAVMRKLKVHNPDQLIPNPTGQGLVQTNAETIEGYLRTISPGGNVAVDRTSGEVAMDTSYCPGFVGGLVQGARSGYELGHSIGSIGGRIPVLGPVIGGLFGFFGAIGGAIGGLFGANVSPASASSTPTGSTCICDFVNSGPETVIKINDVDTPVGAATEVRVPSPNSRKEYGAATVSGRREVAEPWLLLSHELCGHAWLAIHSSSDEEGEANAAPRTSHIIDSQGRMVPNPRRPQAGQFLRHGRTVERENLIRAEHGIEARGHLLRDPYCGESFWRERGVSNAPSAWRAPETGDPTFRTFVEECEHLRRRLPENRDGRYRVDERIP